MAETRDEDGSVTLDSGEVTFTEPEPPPTIDGVYRLLAEVRTDQKRVLESLPPPPSSARIEGRQSIAARAANGTVAGGKWVLTITGALSFLVQFVVAPLLDERFPHLRGPLIEILRGLLAALGAAPPMP